MPMRIFMVALSGVVVSVSGGLLRADADGPAAATGKAALLNNPDLLFVPGHVLVRFSEGASANARADIRAVIDGTLARSYRIVPDLELLHTPMDVEQAVGALRALPGVAFAEPDYVVRKTAVIPNDTFFSLQWGLHNTGQVVGGTAGTPDADIDMVQAWDFGTGAPGFVVAVIDTGTDYTHPDLDDNIWTNPGEIPDNGFDDDGNGFIDDVRGWDFFSDDNDPMDDDGHGTHTAGTIGAEGNNGEGVTGILWDVQIMPLRFLGPNGGSTSDAILAVQYASEMNVRVSNNSWGGGGPSVSLLNAIDAAGDAQHLVIAAAGNDGDDTDVTPHYPSAYDLGNIISVANLTKTDALSGTSNFGATTVDMGAPGTTIASTYIEGQYVFSSGTSMAAPHVAGVAALLWSQNPLWSWQQVKQRLMETTRPVAALSGKCVTGGSLNALAALTPAEPPPPDCGENSGDFNEDGMVNGLDLALMLALWGPQADVPQDMNDDGVVSGLDLAMFLSRWGPCGE